MVAFLKSQGIKILEVPYNGAGPATTALLAGEMEILPVTVASIAGLVKAGKLKALAATTEVTRPSAARRADHAGARLSGYRHGPVERRVRPGRAAAVHGIEAAQGHNERDEVRSRSYSA